MKYYTIIAGLIILNVFLFAYKDKEALGNQVNVRGQVVEIVIDDFTGGIAEDTNAGNFNQVQIIKNFDIKKGTLIPYRDMEFGDSTDVDRDIAGFTFADVNGQDRLYGCGEPQRTNGVAVYYKTSSNLGDNNWTNPPATASSTATDIELEPCIHYKNYIYGAAGSNLWRYGDITGTPTMTAVWQDIVNVPVSNAVWHSKDDILYFGQGNLVSSWDNTTFIEEALVLPTDRQINTMTEYGHYLAIGTESLAQMGLSRVYLWDRNTSLVTVSESIDWGQGQVEVLDVLDGFLVGISHSEATGDFNAKMTFRAYNGEKVTKFLELESDNKYTGNDLIGPAFKHKESLYFKMTITTDGTLRQGIWRLFRPTADSNFTVTLDRTLNNNSNATSSPLISSPFIWGDTMFISWLEGGISYVTKTNDQASFTASSSIETVTFGDKFRKNILRSFGAITEPLPTNGQIDLYYKFDDGLWIRATTSTNIGSMFHEVTINEVTGEIFPQFTRAKFRLDSTGNATTTGLRIKYEILDSITD